MKQTEAFRVLASADRQLILHELCKNDGKATVDELAEQVAVRRHRISPDEITDDRIARAHVRLHHTQLPQLVENGVISHDPNEETVVLHDNESVEQLFAAAEEIEGWPPDDFLERSSSGTHHRSH